jgi:hypothetical protein
MLDLMTRVIPALVLEVTTRAPLALDTMARLGFLEALSLKTGPGAFLTPGVPTGLGGLEPLCLKTSPGGLQPLSVTTSPGGFLSPDLQTSLCRLQALGLSTRLGSSPVPGLFGASPVPGLSSRLGGATLNVSPTRDGGDFGHAHECTDRMVPARTPWGLSVISQVTSGPWRTSVWGSTTRPSARWARRR